MNNILILYTILVVVVVLAYEVNKLYMMDFYNKKVAEYFKKYERLPTTEELEEFITEQVKT